jgi:hypothetical protein
MADRNAVLAQQDLLVLTTSRFSDALLLQDVASGGKRAQSATRTHRTVAEHDERGDNPTANCHSQRPGVLESSL